MLTSSSKELNPSIETIEIEKSPSKYSELFEATYVNDLRIKYIQLCVIKLTLAYHVHNGVNNFINKHFHEIFPTILTLK